MPSSSASAAVQCLAELQTELSSLQQQQQQQQHPLTRSDWLRAELDWLQEEEEDDNDNEHHPQKDPSSWHPLVRRHRELVQILMQLPDDNNNNNDNNDSHQDSTATAAAIAMYDQEIVESYQELVSLNVMLNERIAMEEQRREKLIETLEEYKMIHQVLVTEQNKQQQQQQEQQQVDSIAAASSDDQKQPEPPQHLLLALQREENQQWRDDLKYVTECILQQHNNSLEWHNSNNNHNNNHHNPTRKESLSLLHDVLWQLVDRRIAASFSTPTSSKKDAMEDIRHHPYVSVDDPYLLHLLLHEWHIVDPYDDDDNAESNDRNPLVCLVDYLLASEPPLL